HLGGDPDLRRLRLADISRDRKGQTGRRRLRGSCRDHHPHGAQGLRGAGTGVGWIMARRVPTHGDAVDVESDIHPTKMLPRISRRSGKHRGRTRRRVEDCEASSTRLYRAKPSTWKASTIPTAEHLPHSALSNKKRQHHAGVCSFKLQLSAISYQLSAAGTLCVAQCLDLVMVALHALELALDHHADIGRQLFVERLAIALQGHILATLALVEDGFIILASNQRFEIDPAPMQIAGHAAAGFRITAQ